MKTPRRHFLKAAVFSTAAIGFPTLGFSKLWGQKPPADAPAGKSVLLLPWERELPLRAAARAAGIKRILTASAPTTGTGWRGSGALHVSNPAMRAAIWGTPDRITVSLQKNDVWDRRLNRACTESAPTLQQIIDGANSPANKDFSDIKADSTRPQWGYLRKEGGKYNPYTDGARYPFPSIKPVGQIIFGLDEMAGAESPELTQSCADGVVKFEIAKDAKHAAFECVLSMTQNVYAIRGVFHGLDAPVWLRLFRKQDTAHLRYLLPDGKTFRDEKKRAFYEADRAWNGPLDAPASGQDGKFFWIRQRMPPEKTFPKGLEYVLMGRVAGDAKVAMEAVEGSTGLGTPTSEGEVNETPGAAATAKFTPQANHEMLAYVVVVTTVDAEGRDVVAVAKKRLAAAEKNGFDAIVAENARWFGELYDRRECGRIFTGDTGREVTENISEVFNSWWIRHGGSTKTDMRKFQASCDYNPVESDTGAYGSLPCYNEIFYTPLSVRHRDDAVDMWKQLVRHWMKASEANARDVFGMPGMALLHGFLPPVKADKYVHTNVALELAVDTVAQMIKPWWDEWDYGGDENVLREMYPALREVAIFYAAYAKQGDDGVYHIIPSMQEESWGIQYQFSHSKDCIAAISMFRWAFLRAAEAAALLKKDSSLRPKWIEIAKNLPPYPTWKNPEGLVFAGISGVEPRRGKGEHPWDIGSYPTVLADDINLDSDPDTKAAMLRTVRLLRGGLSGRAAILLGTTLGGDRSRASEPERLLNSRSGRIHLFPCVGESEVIGFRRFQARGGFLVSACRDAGGVTHVEIESRHDLQCHVMNPWPGRAIAVRKANQNTPITFTLDKTNGECIVFHAEAGHSYQLEIA